jgi:dihydrofolate reductase
MKLILACDPLGGIGKDNSLPWPMLEGDLPRFKELTTGQVVVMGKNTWNSLPRKPLPNRLNFVVTSHNMEMPQGAVTVKDLTPFKYFKNAWLIGGAQLVNSSWDYVDEVHLSRTHAHYDCDVAINLVYLESNFMCVQRTDHADHSYEIWTRNNGTISQTT